LSCDLHLCMWLRIMRLGHVLMFVLVVYSYMRTHTLQKKKKKKKKKNFAPGTRVVVVTRRFVTYGIRAGSTRDLGFTTGSVDMIY
jgi:hypothetical protein